MNYINMADDKFFKEHVSSTVPGQSEQTDI